nr:hypothetical protein [Tanacetum cinerariifolium]
ITLEDPISHSFHQVVSELEVIEFGDLYVIPANTTDTTGGDKSGRILTLTAKDMQRKKNDDRGRRDNFKQGSKAEEQAPKALMAIDGVG